MRVLVEISVGLGASVEVIARVAVAATDATVALLSRYAAGMGWQAARTAMARKYALISGSRNIVLQEVNLHNQLFLSPFPTE